MHALGIVIFAFQLNESQTNNKYTGWEYLLQRVHRYYRIADSPSSKSKMRMTGLVNVSSHVSIPTGSGWVSIREAKFNAPIIPSTEQIVRVA